jgi:phosphoesterase RecJ-like protein
VSDRWREALEQAGRLLHNASRILITAHIRPDGDAIGSLLGLGLALEAAGKQTSLVLADGLPGNYKFLVGSEKIVTRPEGDYDLIVTVDCSDLKRVGQALDGYPSPDLNFDHHITNENFARLNLVDSGSVATAEMLALSLPEMGFPLNQPAAAALLTGVVADTLGFRTSNMNPKALRTAADLLEFGIDLPEIFDKTLLLRSFEAIAYWAAGLGRIDRKDGLVWTALTLQDRKAAKYPGRDDADLINVLSSITNIDIAVVFVEQGHGKVKVSWRARPGVDLTPVARSFGGGGHPAAAGAEVHGRLAEVQTRVLQATGVLLGIEDPAIRIAEIHNS